jgi:hypothetical protein
MRSIVLLCTLAILLSGCADWTIDNWNAKQAAKQDTEEDAKCQSNGKPGDPAYDQCRAQVCGTHASGGGGRRIRAEVFGAINTSAVPDTFSLNRRDSGQRRVITQSFPIPHTKKNS